MRVRQAIPISVLTTATAVVALYAVPAPAGQVPDGTVRVATSGNKSELVRSIPVGKRAGAKERSVMSISPGNLGDLRDGDRVEGSAEVEVSVCLKPNRLHTGPGHECVGKTHGYNPNVEAEVVLAGSADATSGIRIASPQQIRCTQRQPNRNHHCVLTVQGGGFNILDAGDLPCDPDECHVNLVMSAFNRGARKGHKLVIGASQDRKVTQDKGRVNVVKFRPGVQTRVRPSVDDSPERGTLKIAGEGGNPKSKVLYSVELTGIREGEQVVVDGRAVAEIRKHRYNAFMTSTLVLSERPNSTSRDGLPERVADINGQIGEPNGFNCTQGKSAHRDPCTANKLGVIEFTKGTSQPLYINFVSGMAAQADFGDRHRKKDKAKVLDRGELRVFRYERD